MSDDNKFLSLFSACLAGRGRFSLSVRLTALKVLRGVQRSAILAAVDASAPRNYFSG